MVDYQKYMLLALEQAKRAGIEVPVGALVVSPAGEVLAAAHNLREAKHDPTSHAEIEAIRAATAARRDWRLDGATLFVTLEPCVMCAGAIREARIARLVFGAWDAKYGASGSTFDLLRDKRIGAETEVLGGVMEEPCSKLLTSFFASLR